MDYAEAKVDGRKRRRNKRETVKALIGKTLEKCYYVRETTKKHEGKSKEAAKKR